MCPAIVMLMPWLLAAAATSEASLVRNPSFEEDADRDGVPDGWQWAGDSRLVAQALSSDAGRDGKRCARLTCTEFKAGNPAAHAMLCQMDVPVRRGTGYRLSFWARAEGVADGLVSLALSDTSVWADCGLQTAFLAAPQWRRYEFVFQALRDCPTKSRLQFWFQSTGTLWLDDVEFVEAGPELYRPGQVVGPAGGKNLIRNASVECGAAGWGSAEWDRTTHWGGLMNRLFGQPDTAQAFHGKTSLRIDLSPENRPVSYFDYYELCRGPILAPLAANLGFIEMEPGKPHTLSVWMKSQADGTPARLAVRQFQGRSFEKGVQVSPQWNRYALTFTPTSRWCYVLAGPDLRPTPENARPPERAVLWLDAVQLEQAGEPSEFSPRTPVEFGLSTEKTGNVFAWDEPIRFVATVANSGAEAADRVRLDLRLTDFADREVWHATRQVALPPGEAIQVPIEIQPAPAFRGFFRLEAKLTSAGAASERSMRLAVIPAYQAGDSRFGVNHAYPWPHLLDLCRKAGLVWVRDWSLKWQDVEPEKGRFTFAETDLQIDRPLEHKLRVLGLLPFPSSNWASSAAGSVTTSGAYPQNRARVAYAPRDAAEFENYVGQTVRHYKDRITWWQVFNEPLYTDYSLPRSHGYTGADYARWTVAFARAARRADPQCRVLAGIGGLSEGVLDDFEKFFAAGGLEAADAIDIHHYPQLRPPESIERLLEQLNAMMDRHGGRKPLWLTEYGYYAEDEPWSVPMPSSGFDNPLASEQLQAEYAVRWAVIMLANGVDKVFYHAGTCGGINAGSLQGVFYEYAGQPHKVYAAQAVMAHLFTPETRFVRRLALGESVKAYLFHDGRRFHEGHRLIAAVWAPGPAPTPLLRLSNDKIQLWDLMGRPQADRQFRPSGTPVYLVADDLTDEAFAAGCNSSP